MNLFYRDLTVYTKAVELASIVPECELMLYSDMETMNLNTALILDADGLWVHTQLFKPLNLKAFYAEFILKRQKQLKQELLLQTINLKIDDVIKVLDLTAGLGRDSLIMALYGYQVTMLENNPYLALILAYLCNEYQAYFNLNLKVIYTDNQEFLKNSQQKYDVIYCDPMFQDGKQALAKKNMQLIDIFLGLTANIQQNEEVNSANWFQLCKINCSKKIIVKRDNKQAFLFANLKPTYSKTGKTIRFDVYQC